MIARVDRDGGRIREVRKRDSRVVPFDETKIASAIYRAFRAVGVGDRPLAAELASAVTHFLEQKFSGSIPGIEDIQDQVEVVLSEMGHARVAKEYILYRQKRSLLRETLEVRKEPRSAFTASSHAEHKDDGEEREGPRRAPVELPAVDRELGGVSSWSKSKIAAALIREADIEPRVAGEVAAAVEHKVLHAGISRISTALIRELVDNELFERGFSATLEKQASIGLPRYSIEQIIFGNDAKEGYTYPKTPAEVRKIIANRILHQYALQEVFTPALADAHRDGRIFIHRLSDPVRLAGLLWTLPLPGAAGLGARRVLSAQATGAEGYLDQGDFFRRLGRISGFFSEEVRLKGLSSLLEDPAPRGLGTGERAVAVLERLAQMAERPRIAIELDLTPEILPWLEGLRAVSRMHPRRFLIALRLHREAFAFSGDLVPHAYPFAASPLLESLASLYEGGEQIEFFPRAGQGDSPRGLVANVAKITVNLPRAAFRSARDSRSCLERELEEVLALAVKGHLERRGFLERTAANREAPLWDVLGGGAAASERGARSAAGEPLVSLATGEYAIGVVGLNECVKFLTGKELHQDPVARRTGEEIIGRMARFLARESRSLGIRLVLEESRNLGPLQALEHADRERHPQAVEIDRGRDSQWGPRYTDGVRFHRVAPLDPLRRIEELAPYLRYLRPAGGVVDDFPELRSSARELLLSLLEESLPALDGELTASRCRGEGTEA